MKKKGETVPELAARSLRDAFHASLADTHHCCAVVSHWIEAMEKKVSKCSSAKRSLQKCVVPLPGESAKEQSKIQFWSALLCGGTAASRD